MIVSTYLPRKCLWLLGKTLAAGSSCAETRLRPLSSQRLFSLRIVPFALSRSNALFPTSPSPTHTKLGLIIALLRTKLLHPIHPLHHLNLLRI
ncbi:hypothetical protein GGS26DRAFT_565527 [Hypomontagnella submonticulosa]|nr:hypothetical protein GGS26DRAFT_565527 [Hypomontagnella submonticulosa]